MFIKYKHMPASKRKFIVLEGIDGSGKSTVSRLLAKSLGAKLVSTPPKGFGSARRAVDSHAQLQSRFFFYLSSVLFASETIEELLKTNHVVCDRYIFSTLGYHQSLGLKIDFDLSSIKFTQPDFTFFLRIEDEVERQRRLRERMRFTKTDALIDDEKVRKKLVREYSRFPMIHIDTSNTSAQEVVMKIREHIKL